MRTGNRVKLQGFVRMELVDVRGPRKGRRRRTPYQKNAITAGGFEHYIVNSIGEGLSGRTVSHVAVATQTDVAASSQTAPLGEFDTRKAVTNSFIANGTLQATASYATNEANASVLGAVALFNTSETGVGTAASVATFATSQKTTDQELRITYQWRFSQA